MRLLLINYEFPPLGGGAGNATQNLAQEMAQMGHEVLVMTAQFADLPAEEKRDGYTLKRIPTLRRAADRSNPLEMLIFLLSSIWQVGKVGKVDYCIAFFGIPSGPAAWVLWQWRGVPYIVSLRGGDVPGFQPYDLKNFHRLTGSTIRFLWRRAAHVVANSQGLAALARQSTPELPIKVIPNGVDTQKFRPAESLPQANWLFVGRLREQKGLYDLVEAVALISAEKRARLKITLVGDGPIREDLIRRMEAHQIRDSFEFAGWVERAKIPEYYRAHRLMILPSLDEGMPNVILEAMACGLPIIATRIAGNDELVDEANGWLVPPRHPAALAQVMEIALDTPLQTLGQQSRARAETYAWRMVAQQYIELMGG